MTAIPLVTKGLSESGQLLNWFLGIDSATGRLAADFESASDDSNHPLIGTTTLANGTWYHAAVDLRRDDLPAVPQRRPGGLGRVANGPGTGSAHHAALGTAMTSTGAATGCFDGVLDEVRIWNVARSAAQLAGRRDQELTAGTGLIARYGLNEGTGTAVGNSVAGGVNGTAVGGPVWGGGARSVPRPTRRRSSAPTSPTRPTPRAPSSASTPTRPTPIADTLTYSATACPAGSTINAATGVITGTLSSTSSGTHNVVDHRRPTASPPTPTPSPGPSPTSLAVNTALDFDGTNDHVTFGAAPASGVHELHASRPGSGATARASTTSTGTGGIDQRDPAGHQGPRGGREPANVNMNYFLGIDATTGVLVADFEDTANGAQPPGHRHHRVPISTVWHHAAVTYDTATDTWNLYLDGVLERTLAARRQLHAASRRASSTPRSAPPSTRTGVTAGFFNGVLDEVRIWNVARTAAQIQATQGPGAHHAAPA